MSHLEKAVADAEALGLRVEIEEAMECIAVMRSWTGGATQLPKVLLDELLELSGCLTDHFIIEFDGPGMLRLALSPRLRALVANLRVRKGPGQR